VRLAVLLLTIFTLGGCGAVDKVLHAGVGVGIAGATHQSMSWQDSCKLSVIAGIGKEVYDGYGNGTVDPKDALATGLSGCIASYIFSSL